MPGSDCTKTYYPSQGGEATAASMGYESAGAVGDKEAMPGALGSMASEDGNHDTAALSALAAAHGMPAVSAYPDNVEGSIMAGNPTAAEGATGPADFPHAGPPPRTTQVGGSNPYE